MQLLLPSAFLCRCRDVRRADSRDRWPRRREQRRERQPKALAKVAAKREEREAAAKQAKKEAKNKKQVGAKRQRAKLLPLSQPSHDSTARDTTIVYAIYGKHDSQELALWQRTWLQVSE